MPGPSPFSDDWRDCLKAHYQHVIRTNDKGTEATLVNVLKKTGFTEEQLSQIYLETTMHVDHMPEDFVPDFTLAEAEDEKVIVAGIDIDTAEDAALTEDSLSDVSGEYLPEEAIAQSVTELSTYDLPVAPDSTDASDVPGAVVEAPSTDEDQLLTAYEAAVMSDSQVVELIEEELEAEEAQEAQAEAEHEDDAEEVPSASQPADDDDAPQQLSMF